MSVALLIFMAVAFMVLAGLLTAAESAYGYLPRHEAEALLQGKAGKPLRRILQHPVAHMHALRFWRVWFEMATAVTVATLFQMLLDNIWLAGLLATVVMAGIGFVLVGVSPRQIGRKHVTAVVVLTAGLVRFLRVVLGPIPGWLVRLGTAVAPGTQGPDAAFFTEEEFRELLDRASEADMIENTEAELIHSVFELGDTKVRSVMVPRTDMVCIEAGSTLRQAMSLFLRSGYSRVPVIEDSADQIVGILYLKDVAAQMHSGSGDPGTLRVEDFARGVRYVPESKAVSELLQELQRESTHVAVVIDEYGGTAGLVTLEDLIEEIVGEIVDEYDSERPEIENLGGGRYRVSSRAGIDDLGELFDVDLEDDEVDTVGGLLAKALGRVPIVGSEVVVDGIVLHAERLEGRRNRVSHIIAWKQPDDAAEPETHSDDGRTSFSRVSSTELVPRND
ncbi:hemolysin family protein [Arthrobacter gengyunqii]|uniref:Hemolysin family protein n=1 Tax=Arthrobacter gengyunqii TaxID=2886940 RepID=A0ABS8GEQ2_9MICC|nr:hemolysin family protein [Arthrobacter gengyunqii]MCC3265119.1 hemolysin family protein [Arthrobacter gengyunqii]